MARRQVEQEDPWAGFVDVLSNVVMVVTFLVIILGIAMFAMAQQLGQKIAEDILKAEQTRKQLEEMQRSQLMSDGDAGSSGVSQAQLERALLQQDEVVGDTDLTVRSRRIDDTEELTIAATEEKVGDQEGVLVESSESLLKLTYQKGFFKLDEPTEAQVRAFLVNNVEGVDALLELRAFATSNIGSVSEARRIAYYRAMSIRTYLIEQGVDPSKLKLVIRESDTPEHANSVWVFAKPN